MESLNQFGLPLMEPENDESLIVEQDTRIKDEPISDEDSVKIKEFPKQTDKVTVNVRKPQEKEDTRPPKFDERNIGVNVEMKHEPTDEYPDTKDELTNEDPDTKDELTNEDPLMVDEKLVDVEKQNQKENPLKFDEEYPKKSSGSKDDKLLKASKDCEEIRFASQEEEPCASTSSSLSSPKSNENHGTGSMENLCTSASGSNEGTGLITSNLRTGRGKNPFLCPECLYTFSSKDRLQTHIKGERFSKPRTCKICSATFARKLCFDVHKRNHREQRPGRFRCDECPFETAHRLSLASHRRCHAGEQSYDCSECNLSFSSPSKRLAHVRSHTYPCTKCSETFGDSDSLKKHMDVYHEDKPFSCPMCPSSFSRFQSLQEHSKTHSN